MTETKRQDYVLGFAFTADRSQVLLIRKNRPEWQAGKFNGIGGKIDPGEKSLAAMCREFQEETGLATEQGDWHYYTKIVGRGGDVFCYRLFDDKVTAAKTMLDEEVVLAPADFSLLVAQGLSNVAWLVAIALDTFQPNFFVTANYNQEFLTGQITDENGMTEQHEKNKATEIA